MNLIQKFEQQHLNQLVEKNPVPSFASGDTVRVNVKVVEGDRERFQAYEGVCIARRNDGIHSSFTVRKISFGEGVERVFPLYSPNITIEVVRRGAVRRAKLYYLRERSGKSARIAEKKDFTTGKAAAAGKAKSGTSAKATAKTAEKSDAPVTPSTATDKDEAKSEVQKIVGAAEKKPETSAKAENSSDTKDQKLASDQSLGEDKEK